MKYLCLSYLEPGKFEGMTEDERNAVLNGCFEYNDHLRANRNLVAEVPLQPPETAVTLYAKKGNVVTTDDPYAETKEQLGGPPNPRSARPQPRPSACLPASRLQVRTRPNRDSPHRGPDPNHPPKRAAPKASRPMSSMALSLPGPPKKINPSKTTQNPHVNPPPSPKLHKTPVPIADFRPQRFGIVTPSKPLQFN